MLVFRSVAVLRSGDIMVDAAFILLHRLLLPRALQADPPFRTRQGTETIKKGGYFFNKCALLLFFLVASVYSSLVAVSSLHTRYLALRKFFPLRSHVPPRPSPLHDIHREAGCACIVRGRGFLQWLRPKLHLRHTVVLIAAVAAAEAAPSSLSERIPRELAQQLPPASLLVL